MRTHLLDSDVETIYLNNKMVFTEEDLDCRAPDDCDIDLDVLMDDEARVYHSNGTIKNIADDLLF